MGQHATRRGCGRVLAEHPLALVSLVAAVVATWWWRQMPPGEGGSDEQAEQWRRHPRLVKLARAAFPDAGQAGPWCDIPTLSHPASHVQGLADSPALFTAPVLDGWTQGWSPARLRREMGQTRAWHRNVSSAIRAQYGHADLRAPGFATSAAHADRSMRRVGAVLEALQAENVSAATGSLFDVSGQGVAAALAGAVPLVPAEVAAGHPSFPRERWRASFSLAPPGEGLAMHSHGAAWQAVLGGAKLWVLAAPGASNETQPPEPQQGGASGAGGPPRWLVAPAAEWVPGLLRRRRSRSTTPADEALKLCIVEAGDMVFVPSAWLHATYNLGTTFAVGGQLAVEAHTDAQLRALVNRHPRSSLLLQAAGQAAFNLHRDTEAERLLQASWDASPSNFKAAGNLVAFHLAVDRIATAARVAQLCHERVKALFATGVASGADVSYVLSYNALLFFERALGMMARDGRGQLRVTQMLQLATLFFQDAASAAALEGPAAFAQRECRRLLDAE